MLALESMLSQGGESRFIARGRIPPVYLSCACNFDRDTETGEIFSYEICIREHQERCQDEAAHEPQVAFCLDPCWGADWLGYFDAKFRLRKEFEIYQGDLFIRNQATTKGIKKGEEAYPVSMLERTTIESFESDARAVSAGSLGHGGCVVAFRYESSDKEPFGIWWGWLVIRGHFFILDLQNSALAGSLGESIESLGWAQPARQEAFFGVFR